jgi:hypothetical protein
VCSPKRRRTGTPGVHAGPVSIRDISRWLEETLHKAAVPSSEAIRERLIEPLLFQLTVDLLPEVALMVRHRIGIGGTPDPLAQGQEASQ